MAVYKMDDQELKKLSHVQVKQLLDGGDWFNIEPTILTTHSKPIYIVRNTKN